MSGASRIEQWFRAILADLHPRGLTREAAELTELARGDGRSTIVAIGKAAIAMSEGAQDALGGQFERGYVLTVDGPDASGLDGRWLVFRASHPIPDRRGFDATQAIIAAVEFLDASDTVVALISGGGSALFEAPRPPLTLADIARVTEELLKAGAPIQHLNAVRIPLSMVKGGAFRRGSPAGRFLTFALSDVLGNAPDIIASGPTVAPRVTAADALAVLDRYGVRTAVPRAVVDVLEYETGTPAAWDFPRDRYRIIGDNALARQLATDRSRADGFTTCVIADPFEGEAAALGRAWVHRLLAMPGEVDVVWGGGEATVTVVGEGKGGRNTEFALAASIELDRLGVDDWTIASLATDGQDGTSGSAGAVGSRETIVRARDLGIDPTHALAVNDTATFFDRVGGLVVTGPSGTNVNDLYVGLRHSAQS